MFFLACMVVKPVYHWQYFASMGSRPLVQLDCFGTLVPGWYGKFESYKAQRPKKGIESSWKLKSITRVKPAAVLLFVVCILEVVWSVYQSYLHSAVSLMLWMRCRICKHYLFVVMQSSTVELDTFKHILHTCFVFCSFSRRTEHIFTHVCKICLNVSSSTVDDCITTNR